MDSPVKENDDNEVNSDEYVFIYKISDLVQLRVYFSFPSSF